MLKIGDFSRLTFVSVKTLRYYDEFGLLKPLKVDEFTGYRYYTAEQLPRLNRILALKDLGLSLEEIKTLLDEEPTADQIRGMLRLKKFEAEERVAEERARLVRVEARLIQIEREGKMPMYEVVLKKIPAQRVAAVRRNIPDYGHLGELYGELFGCLGRSGARPTGPTIAIYHDPEFKEQNPDVEAAIPVAGDLPDGGAVRIRELPAAEMASTIYQGKYEEIGNGYNAVMAWLEPNGYRLAGPIREVYLRGPGDTQDPSQYVTEIQAPVEKA
ncbi:MAG: MerR family transcriptional regulator [Bacteroidota bacterium]